MTNDMSLLYRKIKPGTRLFLLLPSNLSRRDRQAGRQIDRERERERERERDVYSVGAQHRLRENWERCTHSYKNVQLTSYA